MAVTINASASSSGLVTTADGSGIVKLQSNGVATNALLWINLLGSGPTARSSYNTSSITRSAAGRYNFNFSVSTSDANYVTVLNGSVDTAASNWMAVNVLYATTSGSFYTAPSTSTFNVFFLYGNSYNYNLDPQYGSVVVFGN